MLFSSKQKCNEVKQLEHKRNNAKTPAQRSLFQSMIDSHKNSCDKCNPNKKK